MITIYNVLNDIDKKDYLNFEIDKLKCKRKKLGRYRGVFLNKKNIRCWGSQIKVNNKRIFLGYFHTEIEAAKRYNKYVIDNNLNRYLNIFEGR